MPHEHEHAHEPGHGHGHAHAGPPPSFSDPAQQSLVNALRSSFGVLRVLMLVLVVMYLLSGVFQVGPGEQGLIVRFGRLVMNKTEGSPYQGTPVFEQGWQVALPDPFDEKIRISGQTQVQLSAAFLFSVRPEELSRPLSDLAPRTGGLRPGQDGAMLTGDRNLSHGLWEVEFRIEEADRYVRNVGESVAALEPLLRRLLEASVVREVAAWRVEDVTRERVDDVRRAVQSRLQQSLQALDTGVLLTEVRARTIEPGSVRDAFNEVTRAENDKETAIKGATQKAIETLNQAAGDSYAALLERINALGAAQAADAGEAELRELRGAIDTELERASGQVAIRLREARSEAGGVHERLTREHEQFTYYLAQYRVNPSLTLLSLWLAMRSDVLGDKQNEVFFVSSSGDIEIWGNRDPRRAHDAEMERLTQRAQQITPPPGGGR